MQRLQATEKIDEHLRFDRPRKLSLEREDMLITWFSMIIRFATSARIRAELNFWGHVSVRTVNGRRNDQRLCARQNKMATTVITLSKGSMELVM